MDITKKLRDWLIENEDVKKDASDDEFRKAAGAAIALGRLSAEKLQELTKDEKAEQVKSVANKLDSISDGIAKLVEVTLKEKEAPEEKKLEEKKTETEEKEVKDEEKKTAPETKDMKDVSETVSKMGGTPADPEGEKKVAGRMKSVAEKYSTTKTAMMYPDRTKRGTPHVLAGQRVTLQGKGMDTPSDRDMALAGAWAKFQLASVTPRIAGSPQRAWELLPEEDKGLLHYLVEECDWDNSEDSKSRITKGYRGGIKTLIDDAVGGSGGLEAAPIVFDDQVIQTPLLYGELYPLVNEVPLARGRRVEGVATGTVTGGWGGVDATAITLFNTTNYVAAFDTTVYRWEGAIQIGLDFMEDTPIDFGQHITTQYGERLLEDLDDVIAIGNGATQPQGVMNCGAAVVAFGGATTLGAYETLMFTVGKAEHKANLMNSAVFCGTETSYQRVRAINVGATDARRLGGGMSGVDGTGYRSYQWMDRPYKINQSLANTQIFYAILGRYRMYRRKGFTVRTSTEGDNLVRSNELLIVVMARYGGQMERAACAALTTTAPA